MLFLLTAIRRGLSRGVTADKLLRGLGRALLREGAGPPTVCPASSVGPRSGPWLINLAKSLTLWMLGAQNKRIRIKTRRCNDNQQLQQKQQPRAKVSNSEQTKQTNTFINTRSIRISMPPTGIRQPESYQVASVIQAQCAFVIISGSMT